jgi:hypothetical protein
MTRIYDSITGKWYKLTRGLLGRPSIKEMKNCSDKPKDGDIVLDETGITFLPPCDKENGYLV